MAKQHPWPAHIVEAVARALADRNDIRGFGAGGDWDALGYEIRQEFLAHAHAALAALWDASRVDLGDSVANLPDDAVILSNNNEWNSPATFHHNATAEHYPAAVIFWGEPDV